MEEENTETSKKRALHIENPHEGRKVPHHLNHEFGL